MAARGTNFRGRDSFVTSDIQDQERYEIDPDDGLKRAVVGAWVHDKHLRLRSYVDITRSVRGKYVNRAGATYIELFSGPGRACIKGTKEVADGSPLVAWNESVAGKCPFTEVHVCDADSDLLHAAVSRLRHKGAPVFPELGPAHETIDRVISKLNPAALHFAFLDPFNLGAMSFELLRKLTAFRRMDILVHVSAMDLQMNLQSYIDRRESPLDSFAPGWRDNVDVRRSPKLVRMKILEHWRKLLHDAGMQTTRTDELELIAGTKNQRLYWLAFAAHHDRALEFWGKIRAAGESRQPDLFSQPE